MPVSADIGRLIRFLAYLGNHRMRLYRFKKSVNVNLPPTPGKLNVLIGCYNLVTKKYNAVIDIGLSYFGKLFVANPGCDIDTSYFSTYCRTHRCGFYGFIFSFHRSLNNLFTACFA